MSTETAPQPRRARLFGRPRVPDLLIAAFLAILAAAIVVNGIADVHDTRRARFDKKVADAWFKSHPQLGKFGPPVVKVHKHVDIACAPRKAAVGGSGKASTPVDGYCIWIQDTSLKSQAIQRVHRCMYIRPHVVRPVGTPSCPQAHGPT
jgi:hypothetical protein